MNTPSRPWETTKTSEPKAPSQGTAKAPKKVADKRRVYIFKDGTRATGVTTMLNVMSKPGLVPWANNLGLRGINSATYVDGLAQIGTLAHLMCENHLGGQAVDRAAFPDVTDDQFKQASICFHKYLDWESKHEIELICSEAALVSERFRFGGTIDAIMKIDGVVSILDLKTAKQIYDDHLYQVAAYATLAEEHGHTIEAIRILQIGRAPDEGFEEKIKTREEIGHYWRVFDAARKLYFAKRGIDIEALPA